MFYCEKISNQVERCSIFLTRIPLGSTYLELAFQSVVALYDSVPDDLIKGLKDPMEIEDIMRNNPHFFSRYIRASKQDSPLNKSRLIGDTDMQIRYRAIRFCLKQIINELYRAGILVPTKVITTRGKDVPAEPMPKVEI